MDLRVLHKRQVPSASAQSSAEISVARTRLVVLMAFFLCAFLGITGRVSCLMVNIKKETAAEVAESWPAQEVMRRADIVDRNDVVLATSLVMQSLYADPKAILNADEAAKLLTQVFPELSIKKLKSKLTMDRHFVWVKRGLTPVQQDRVLSLGIPGVFLKREERRIYPHGRLFSHVLGCTDVDNQGVAGLEKSFNESLLNEKEELKLSLDVRLQHVLRDEIARKINEFNAVGGSGVVMDIHTGEIMAMVSYPDYDPHNLSKATAKDLFNSASLGVFEVGSSMKIITTALALESGAVGLQSRYDISEPIKVGRFRIKDYHPQKIIADIPLIFLCSSNIGMVKMIQDVGVKKHREFLGKFGLLSPALVEIPEVGMPIIPASWREINSMTIAYGYGLSASVIQVSNAIASIVNGGILRRPSLLKRNPAEVPKGERIISQKNSSIMCDLLRLAVQYGTGKKANVSGYDVGGKTGTAEKISQKGGYSKDNVVSFVAAFPMSKPKYLVMVVIDEPKGNKASHGFATAGWIAAPAVGNVIQRIAPLLSVQPIVMEEASSAQYEIFKASARGH